MSMIVLNNKTLKMKDEDIVIESKHKQHYFEGANSNAWQRNYICCHPAPNWTTGYMPYGLSRQWQSIHENTHIKCVNMTLIGVYCAIMLPIKW